LGKEDIKAVIFDVDGTLYQSQEYEKHLYRCIVRVISESLGVEMQEAAEKLRQMKNIYKTVSRSVEALGINRHRFYELLSIYAEPRNYIKHNPRTAYVLRELRRRGYKVALHTNSGRRLAEKVLDAIGIERDCYDVLITSDDAEPKPSLNGYFMCLDRLGAKPEETLYVGDRAEVELKPAKEAGMKTAIIGGKRTNHEFIDYFLNSLDSVLNILADE